MTAVVDLRAHLDALEAIQRRLGEVSRRADAERANDLVQGRRELAAKLHDIINGGDALLSRVGTPDQLREFRQRLSAMRAGSAALQAQWPAVRVRDEGGADYAAQVAAVRTADKACIAWMREMLTALDRAGRTS